MKPRISIDAISIKLPVEHPCRRGPAEIETISIEVHDVAIRVWDVGCQNCAEIFPFHLGDTPAWLGQRDISAFEHLDALHRFAAEQYAANRGNLVGVHLEPAMRAMETAIAARDGSSVYFAEADGRIKIGWSRKVSTRLAQLQTGSGVPIRLLGTMPGGLAVERRIHRQFAAARLSGEWFTATPELLDFIAREAS
jgi:hypothetical protein